jgi:hypothetical protein
MSEYEFIMSFFRSIIRRNYSEYCNIIVIADATTMQFMARMVHGTCVPVHYSY